MREEMSLQTYFKSLYLSYSRLLPLLLIKLLRLRYFSGLAALLFDSNNRKKLIPSGPYILCIYDCAMLPVTFNIVEFLAQFNYIASTTGKKFYTVIIDSGLARSSRSQAGISTFSNSSHIYRVRNLLSPLVELFPESAGLIVIKDKRDYYSLFKPCAIVPDDYSPYAFNSNNMDITRYSHVGRSFAQIQSTPYARRLAKEIVQQAEKRIITITLRASDFDPARNSSLCDIAQFVSYIDTLGFKAVVIPDSDNPCAYLPIKNEDIFLPFSYNLDLRVALYELSLVNFFASNGPAILSSMSSSSCITVLMNVFSKDSVVDTPENYALANTVPGEPYFWYNKNSRNSTLPDTYENLKATLDTILSEIGN
jgi:hypothetical protein